MIEYSVPADNSDNKTKIVIVDSAGKTVKTWDIENSVGEHEKWWDGKNDDGFNISQGLYIILLKSGDQIKASWIMASK